MASANCAVVGLRVSTSTSTNTGLRPSWIAGLMVVGNPTAGVMTSSPGTSGRSCSGDISAAVASRLACEPEPTSAAACRPAASAKPVRNAVAKRPSVSQASSTDSASDSRSSASSTLRPVGTTVSPATNGSATSSCSA